MKPATQQGACSITNRVALILGLMIVLLIIADIVVNDGHFVLSLGRRGIQLIDYLQFWR